MTQTTEITPSAAAVDKSGKRVRRMFSSIAPRYDRLNHLLSLNIDRYWRWRTVRRVPPSGPAPILDLCTGTGDLALAYHHAGDRPTPVVAADFCHEMLVVGADKAHRAHAAEVTFLEADAQHLPLPDDLFQIVCVAFGLRNIADTDRGLAEMTRVCRAGNVRVYGGGGGTITDAEIASLHERGVARIFSVADGRALGLEGMIRTIVEESSVRTIERVGDEIDRLSPADPRSVARLITWLESEGEEGGARVDEVRARLEARRTRPPAPVVGITGTGGAGKSSLLDELVRRYRREFPERSLGLLLVDPTRRRTGGALLGDRIRMNAIYGRSGARSSTAFPASTCAFATRQAHSGYEPGPPPKH